MNKALSGAADVRSDLESHADASRWRTFIHGRGAQLRTDFRLLQSVVVEAFLQRDLASAAQAIATHFPSFINVKLILERERELDINTFRWDVGNDRTHCFCICPRLLDLEHGRIYGIVSRWVACLRMASRYDVGVRRTGTAFIDVGDWSDGPALCFSDHRAEALLIPDSSFLESNGYEDARVWGQEGNAPAWRDRKPVAVWRGSSTGVSTSGLLDLPRSRLCALAVGCSILDAGINGVVQAQTHEDGESLRTSGLCKPHIPMSEHPRWKYQIDIDGNTNSWPGLFQKLLTGGPVLKVLSPEHYRQWYYSRLVPWYNYVPIRTDLSDLVPTLNYLLRHDDLARSIGAAGRALAMDMTLDAEVERAMPVVEAAFALGTYTVQGG